MSKKLINKSSNPLKKKSSMGPFDARSVSPDMILDWLEKRGLTEVEFENEDFAFRASKRAGAEFPSFAYSSNGPASGPSGPTTTPIQNASENSKLKKILSPFVGTFYRSSNPDSDPFVKEGQRVSKGDTLCIIEAMKLMNEIEAEIQGRITAILIQNGQPVEFGEPLFVIDPDL